MKNISIFWILLFVYGCDVAKEDSYCHHNLTVINKSDTTVIYAILAYTSADNEKCFLSKRAELMPNESYDEQLLTSCWEGDIETRGFEFYIVDPSKFNTADFYDCDSVRFKNKILEHYILTKADLSMLKASNFTIRYP